MFIIFQILPILNVENFILCRPKIVNVDSHTLMDRAKKGV